MSAPITAATGARTRRRLALVLWLAGMLGAVVVTVSVLPQLLRDATLPAPLWAISIASLAQSALLIAVAAWAGAALAPKVDLRAPAFEAATSGRPIGQALRPQLLPGLVAGVLGGLLLLAVGRFAPSALADVQARYNPPLLARILYGGITEEVLLRWGLMTTLVWLAWRYLQHRTGSPRRGYVWLAIAVSAFLFGVGHLPAASALLGTVDVEVAAFVVGANSVFGLLFGYLFSRWGLESAMIAHAMAHVVSYVGNLL